MLVVKIMGGLGNQLFQYSLALLLQQAGRDVVLEKSYFLKDSYKRSYLLDILPERIPLLEDKAVKLLMGKKLSNRLQRLWVGKKRPVIIKETSETDWQAVLALDSEQDYHIVGYWQDAEMIMAETQLRHDLSVLRSDITIPVEMSKATVAVHVRQLWEYDAKGNKFANHNKTGSDTVWLPVDYYANAINFIKEKLNNPVFTIFGDDEKFCRENILPLTTAGSIVIPAGERPDWQDMLLMSNYKAIICANSTFSWWSGMLCDGLVVAPKIWSKEQEQIAKIYVPHWTKL